MNDILISIIIPAYNSARYINRCLNSCLNQTFLKAELIVIDDGSNDGTLEIIKKFSKHNPYFQVIQTQHNGAAHARNIGINNAIGRYILFVDADDFLEPNMVNNMYKQTLIETPDIVVCDYRIVQNNNIVSINKLNLPDIILEGKFCGLYGLKDKYTPTCWNKMFRRDFIKQWGLKFPEDIISGHDLLFVFSAFLRSRKIILLSNSLYNYCIFPNSLSHDISLYHIKSYEKVMKYFAHAAKPYFQNSKVAEFFYYYKIKFFQRIIRILYEKRAFSLLPLIEKLMIENNCSLDN